MDISIGMTRFLGDEHIETEADYSLSDDWFPCLIVICGSGNPILKVRQTSMQCCLVYGIRRKKLDSSVVYSGGETKGKWPLLGSKQNVSTSDLATRGCSTRFWPCGVLYVLSPPLLLLLKAPFTQGPLTHSQVSPSLAQESPMARPCSPLTRGFVLPS